jgi:hypothetical protein
MSCIYQLIDWEFIRSLHFWCYVTGSIIYLVIDALENQQ